MKRMMVTGVLALAALAFTGQQASAWCKFGLGVGLNLNWESGGNCFAWGLYKSGPPPGAYQPYPVPVPVPVYADHGPAPAYNGPEFAPAYAPAHAPPTRRPSRPCSTSHSRSTSHSTSRSHNCPAAGADAVRQHLPQSGSTPVGWWGATGYYWQGN